MQKDLIYFVVRLVNTVIDMATLRMTYKSVNGYNVCHDGEVSINHIRHRISNGFVKCDSSLNRFAWNTTEETHVCPKCYHQPVQLELF